MSRRMPVRLRIPSSTVPLVLAALLAMTSGVTAPVAAQETLGDVILKEVAREGTRQLIRAWVDSATRIQSNGSVDDLWVNFTASRGGEQGMLIQAQATVHGKRGEPMQAVAYFARSNGSPLADTNGAYRTRDGQVAWSVPFLPQGQQHREVVELFMPYSELHLSRGDHQLRLDFQIFDSRTGDLFGQWGNYRFAVQQP